MLFFFIRQNPAQVSYSHRKFSAEGFPDASALSRPVLPYPCKKCILRLITISVVGLVVHYTVGAVYFCLIKNLYVGDSMAFSMIVVQYCLITTLPDFILCVLACELCARLKPHIAKFIA